MPSPVPRPNRARLLSLSTSGLDSNMAEEGEPVFIEDDDDEDGQESAELGGYDHEFIDPVLSSQKCVVCLLPMKDAVQTKCGHRFCGVCLKRSIR